MQDYTRPFLLLTLLMMPVAGQIQDAHSFALLEPGTFHGSDVSVDQPPTWIGIYCKGKSCSAQQTTIHSTRVPDPLGNDDPKVPTGTEIGVSTPDQPLFLVRGISVRKDALPTFLAGEQSMVAGDELAIPFLGSKLELRVKGSKTEKEPLPKGSQLVLSEGSLTQVLFSLPEGGDDPYITVLWIGDLDGDGKPDLYLDTTWHYNLSHKVLWLSSLAKRGEIVGQAAVFATTGC